MRPAIELEQRLTCRRKAEELHRKGREAHGRGDYILRHDRLVGPVLRTALQAVGLYRRGCRNAVRPVVRHTTVRIPQLPSSFSHFRILHMSDFHIDGVQGLAEVIAETVSRHPVDACVLTGDYRFETGGEYDLVLPRMRMALSRVQSHYGIIGILGNHDCADLAVDLSKIGVRMLINDAIELRKGVDSIWIAGVDDPHYYGCDDLGRALEGVPDGSTRILLAHSPEIYEEAASAGIQLYLCGHTHGGQICLPWLGPFVLNAKCPREYTCGAWHHRSLQGYTSAGVGCSMLPVRYNCPPEITVLELVAD